MGRQRKAEPEAAVKAAQELFREHGFAGLGTRQIAEDAGLTRFTLQSTYGGKKALFLKAIDDYLDYVEGSFLPAANIDNFEELALWFESRSDPACLPDTFRHGCLMLNSIVELHGQDLEFNTRAERFFPMVHERFRAILEAAKSSSASSVEFVVSEKVQLLMGLMLSMAVVIRAGGSVVSAKPMAMAASTMIREWENI